MTGPANLSTCHILLEHSPDAIAQYDDSLLHLFVNPSYARMAEMPAADLLGKRLSDCVSLAFVADYEKNLAAVFTDGMKREMEIVWRRSTGKRISLRVLMLPELSGNQKVSRVVVTGRDISAARETDYCLQRIETMAHIGHWRWCFADGSSQTSAEFCRIFGRSPGWQPTLDEMLGCVIDDDRERVREAYTSAFAQKLHEISFSFRAWNDTETLYLHTHARIDYSANGLPHNLLAITLDVSELKNYEARLQEMSFQDALTGLPNRALFNDRLRQNLAEANRRGHVLGLLVIDLDRFKDINDTYGHSIGDRLLYETGERLRRLVREYDTVARLGGDEFAIVLPEIREASDLGGVASKILDALSRPFHIDGRDMFISASIGISVFPSDGETAANLLRYADMALYDAKNRGRSSFRFYATELTLKSRGRAELEAALRRAEPDGALELYFQPKIRLEDQALVGAEALLRWHHPILGMVPPDRFIGIAEDSGLIVGIGAWVLTKACLAAQQWNRDSGRELKIAVNLSARQFALDDLVATVNSALSITGCEPRWLELEITESLLLGDNERVRETLQTFREMGITIAIDDFGTGYSALGYLKRFPIDVLKIDRSFIRDVMIDHDSTELVKAIIHMARSLNLELVAEGVETETHETFLRTQGCQLAQGYFYSKPVPAEQFNALPILASAPSASVTSI